MGNRKSRQISPTNSRSSNIRKRGSNEKRGRYLPAPTFQIYVALFDYEARSNSDITFKKGDLMEVLPQTEARDWLMVKHLISKKRGLVPASFVAIKDSMQAQE